MSRLLEYWTLEVMEVHGVQEGQDVLKPINVVVHCDRGIALGNAMGIISNDDPLGVYIADILHVPSRKRMFTIAARLGEAAAVGFMLASLARWQDHEDAEAFLLANDHLRAIIATLMYKEYALVMPGSRDEERLHQLAFALANPSPHPAGHA